MNGEISRKSVRLGALLLMVPVAAELVFYTFYSFRRAIRFSFTEPDRWNTYWRVDPGTYIELAPRFSYFVLWSAVILASVMALIVGLYILNRCRQGLVFDAKTARALQVLGGVMAFAMVIDQVFQAVDVYLLTRFNAAGPDPVAWVYDPSDVKTFIMAVIVILFSWVMRKGIEVDRENRGYV